MLYLRDEFFQHPKFATWKRSERWDLLELMGYLSRYNSAGLVPKNRSLLPRNVTEKTIQKAIQTGWIDVDEQGNERFHDWEKHNAPRREDPTNAQRQAKWRERRNADSNVTSNAGAVTDESNVSLARAPEANPSQGEARDLHQEGLSSSTGSTTSEPPPDSTLGSAVGSSGDSPLPVAAECPVCGPLHMVSVGFDLAAHVENTHGLELEQVLASRSEEVEKVRREWAEAS